MFIKQLQTLRNNKYKIIREPNVLKIILKL